MPITTAPRIHSVPSVKLRLEYSGIEHSLHTINWKTLRLDQEANKLKGGLRLDHTLNDVI